MKVNRAGFTLTLFICLLAVAACAPRLQGLGPAATTGFIEPRIEADAFVTRDNLWLGLSRWEAEGPHAVLIAAHGMNDYGNAFAASGAWWAERGITTYAYDQRGHGRSPERGIWPGNDLLTQDFADFTEAVRRDHPGLPVFVLGHSMGGAVVITTLAEGRAQVEGAILVAPAVWGWSTIPFPLDFALWATAHTVPMLTVTGESLNRWPTDNIDDLRAMAIDPNMIFETRFDALYGVVSLMDRAYDEASEVPPPVLLLYGEQDQIIPRKPVDDVIERMCPDRRVAIYADGYHLLLRDLEAEIVWNDIAAFIEDTAAALPSSAEGRGRELHPCPNPGR